MYIVKSYSIFESFSVFILGKSQHLWEERKTEGLYPLYRQADWGPEKFATRITISDVLLNV